MQKFKSVGARPLGATAAALAIGLASAASFAGPAAATPKTGSASVSNRTLQVTGTNGDDAVALQSDGTSALVSFGDPANVQRFNLTDFDNIRVSLGNGDDQFTEQQGVLSTKATTVDGGNGNDTIQTGDGADTIFGGNGDDHVDAGRGNDTVILGNGDDSFVWNPGEGSDFVDGGNGNADVMQFNGSNANEIMSLSANGSQAVFLRDVAAIRMDMNNLEIFNLKALGGADNITVGNLQGTGVKHANLDLSGSNGGTDGLADAVTVDGTDRADRVNVTAANGQVDIAGFPAETTITGSDTLDHLQVNTLGGNDKVTVDPTVPTLIGVGVDLGSGQR
jgi:hypothetical protein